MQVQQRLRLQLVVVVVVMEHAGLLQCHCEECRFHFRCVKQSLLLQQQMQKTTMNEMGAELRLTNTVRSSHDRV